MRDFLVDIVAHTQALGVVETVKITGDDKSTILESVTDNRTLVLQAKFKEPNPAFAGVFGMPNLGKLNTLLNIPEYKENAKIEVVTGIRNGENVPTGLYFENESGDFTNDYRFMTTEVINSKMKTTTFKGATWHITMEPTIVSINRLRYQAQANSEEEYFIAKTDGADLKFYFGDHSTHAGDFVFQHATNGKLTKGWAWPVALFQSILNLQGDKVIQFSDDGVALITVDSGLIAYEYYMLAQTK
jgi:hypothetical protein